MNILFDIGHPAHVHLFKNFIFYLQNNGHEVTVVSRNKDVTGKLLDHYRINNLQITSPSSSFFGMALEFFKRTFFIYSLYRKKRFDFAFGTSFSIGFISLFTKMKSYNFCEDDDDIVPLYAYLTYPFSTQIINPDGLVFRKWKNKRKLYSSYHELAYLHPDTFRADIKILEKYNLEPHNYIIIRHSALKAYHDYGKTGLNKNIWTEIEKKLAGFQIITSKENSKNHDIEPWDMHHILAFAKLLITDSQTMAMEAAVLGVPSLRYNSFVGRISCLEEAESVFGLTYGFLPGRDEANLLLKLDELLKDKKLEKNWKNKSDYMLTKKNNFNQWLINFFEGIKNEQ